MLFVLVGIPIGISWQTNRMASLALEQSMSRDELVSEAAVSRLRTLRWFIDPEDVLQAYANEEDGSRKARLGRAYNALTGEDADEVLYVRRD